MYSSPFVVVTATLLTLVQCHAGARCGHASQAFTQSQAFAQAQTSSQGHSYNAAQVPAYNSPNYQAPAPAHSGNAPAPVHNGHAPSQSAVTFPIAHDEGGNLRLVTIGNNQFYFSDLETKLKWAEASQFCNSNGMRLANIESAEENALVHAFVKKQYERRFWGFWLGATDQAQEGYWTWEGIQQPVAYTNWDDDQPGGGVRENCLVLHRSDGAWNDFECDRTFSFICKRSGDGSNQFSSSVPSAPSAAINDNNIIAKKDIKITTKIYSGLEVVQLGTRQFYFSNRESKLNWANAQAFCKSHRMELASIKSMPENEMIHSHLKKLYERSFWGVWIGGNDLQQEGTWTWDATHEPLSYDNFDNDQPGGGISENCLLFHRSDGHWNDFDCSRQFIFICQVAN